MNSAFTHPDFKDNALAMTKTGAIMAGKRVDELIPPCHTLPLDHVNINLEDLPELPGLKILAETHCHRRTGVEMEALVAAQIAASIICDMCKTARRDITITDMRPLYKNGGKSGEYNIMGSENADSQY